jgi:death-on-curing protein
VALAQSALAAPFAGLGDYELYPTLADKAAIYCSRIVRNHPLVDGNKRTAYDVMVEFVERTARPSRTLTAISWRRPKSSRGWQPT